jgi:hypothetical protein
MAGRLKAIGYDNPGMPFFTAAGLGMIPGCTRVTALGHNPSIASGAAADVWEGGGDYPFLATASQLEVLSASANDAAAGTGVRTVLVSGLDANYNPISEVVTLNGVTPVATVKSYLRTNVFTSTASGSGGTNAGDITLRVAGGGTTQSIMRAGYGFGRSAVYSTPAGFTLFVLSEVFTILAQGSTNSATFGGVLRSQAGNRRIPLEFQVTSVGPYRHDAVLGIIMAEKTDFILRVTTTGQAGTNVTAAFEALQVDNLLLA